MSVLDLTGKTGLVVGIATAKPIAYGGATACHQAGAERAIRCLHAGVDARSHIVA
jgi:enoyl-[acyl-carrier-protein] reductase (NADH)